MQIDRLCTCGSLVIDVCRIIKISKIEFFNFSGIERINYFDELNYIDLFITNTSFVSSTNVVREAKNLPPNFKGIT